MEPIQVTEEAGSLRLAWDNRAVPKDQPVFWGFLVFGAFSATMSVVAASLAGTEEGSARWFLTVVSAFGLLMTLGILHTLLMRRWSEWVEVTAASVTIGVAGPLAWRPGTFPVATIREIALGWCHDGINEESTMTLNLIRNDVGRLRHRVTFGYWLAPAVKRRVFDEIRRFVITRAIPIAVVHHRVGDIGKFEDRWAIIDGVSYEEGPMSPAHAAELELAETAIRGAFGPGWRFRSRSPLVLGQNLNPQPDFAVIAGSTRGNTGHPTTADLVVEVADSSLDFDTNQKRLIYAKAGIREYWVVDINGRRLLVYRDPRAGDYVTQQTLGPTDAVSPLAASTASVRVADLLV